MNLRLRLIDKQTGEVVKVEKIEFHDGRAHIINSWVAKKYEIQKAFYDASNADDFKWVPVDMEFEG